jgi:prophage regulatory protein
MYLRDVDVAKRFGVARSTIWRWVHLGILPQPYRLGPSTTRWPEKDIVAFEARAAGRWGNPR